ncbi:hypothetical protein SAMN05443244_0504 [Terriglobus roseus]|uniref:Uncharacterized protein n=1 Tax=Terriglobus roseus TaxID=392734 RepID=A0A1H4JBI0_9BACT|nr:hypothetical protein SAMN05443244_0504 [Terriglobus roseus]
MFDGKLHKTSEIKRGSGERIFLAFAGRRHRSDRLDYPAKFDLRGELIGMLIMAAFAAMILIVLWRHFSVTH